MGGIRGCSGTDTQYWRQEPQGLLTDSLGDDISPQLFGWKGNKREKKKEEELQSIKSNQIKCKRFHLQKAKKWTRL